VIRTGMQFYFMSNQKNSKKSAATRQETLMSYCEMSRRMRSIIALHDSHSWNHGSVYIQNVKCITKSTLVLRQLQLCRHIARTPASTRHM